MTEIIVVPSMELPLLPIPVIDRYSGYPSNNSQLVAYPEYRPVDHLAEYRAWYGVGSKTITVWDNDIRFRFWNDKRRFRGFVHAKACGTVLVQRLTGQEGWHLAFETDEIADDFYRAFLAAGPHRFELRLSAAQQEEAKEWLASNLNGEHRSWANWDKLTVEIDDDDEALHFKLRWIGVEKDEAA